MNIPWKDTNGGTTILVEKENINKARMNLAVEGFPNKDFSWNDALNSNNSFTMTSEEKRVRFLRAQMTELAKTIQTLDGVSDSEVHLTVPESSNFLVEDNSKNSKASVVVTLKPGYRLSDEQVNGIVMIVANAVEGLKPENVSVHDSSGQILNNNQEDTENYSITNQMNMQDEVKYNVEQSIKSLLSKIYGANNVDVAVNVKLDFDKVITESSEFSTPIEGETNGLIRSVTELKEQVINGSDGGVPGTDSNSQDITNYEELDGGNSKYDKENRTINYELNEIRRNIVKAPANNNRDIIPKLQVGRVERADESSSLLI